MEIDVIWDSAIQKLSSLDAELRRGFLLKLLDTLQDSDIRFLHKCILKKGFPGSFATQSSFPASPAGIVPQLTASPGSPFQFSFTSLDPFLDIADELVVHILSYLHDPKALSACARVNKRFYRTLTDNSLWKRVCGNASFAPMHPMVSLASSSSRDLSNNHTNSIRIQRIRQSSSNQNLAHHSVGRHFLSASSLLSATSISSASSSRSPLFSRRVSKIPRPVSLAPWKKVFKDNYLTLVNWMQGRYTVQSVRHVSQHGQLCLQFNHSRAVSVSVGQGGRVWDVNTGRAYFTLEGHRGPISTAHITEPEFTPFRKDSETQTEAEDENYILTASTDQTVKVWDMNTGICKATLSGPTEELCSLSYSKPFVVAGSEDRRLYVWNIDVNVEQHGQQSSNEVLVGHSGAVTAVQVKGDLIVSGSTDKTVRLWNRSQETSLTSTTFKHVKTLTGHTGTVFCVQFDKHYIASGSEDTNILLYKTHPLSLHKRLQGHTSSVICLQFDATKLVSGSGDNTIRVWDLKTGHCMYILKGHSGTIWNLKFNQTKMISSSLDQSVLIWDFASKGINGLEDAESELDPDEHMEDVE